MSKRNGPRLQALLPIAALALAGSLLGGCGFTPLYADKGVVGGLAHIQVETPQTRTGYLIREQLQQDLALKPDDTPQYRLVVEVAEARLARGLRPDATADRYETRLKLNYTLTRIATGEVVLQRATPVSVTTDATAQPYAGVAAQQDAEQRAAWEAAQFIKTEIVRVLAAK